MVVKEETIKVDNKKPNLYSSDKIYQNLADANNYRWDILNALLKCIVVYLKDKLLDITLHQELMYSVLPAMIFQMLKSYSISEVLQSDKMKAYHTLLNLIDMVSQHVEYGDMFIDREYGDMDSEVCIYDLFKKLNEEGSFFGDTTKS